MSTIRAKQPYYSQNAFATFLLGMAMPYSVLSHVWIYAILQRRNVVRALPASTAENRAKLAIVTGSNTGLGYETARTLVVDYGWEVVLACRSKDKAIRAMDAINAEATSGGKAVVLDTILDLADFDSAEAFANCVKKQYSGRNIDVLINNAGINSSGRAAGNFDLMFCANFLGHFVLTQQLLEKMRGGRIINLSSVMHHFTSSEDKNAEFWRKMIFYQPPEKGEIQTTYDLTDMYSASKLAAILFSNELSRRYGKSHGIKTMTVNPGSCATDIWRSFGPMVQRIVKVLYLTSKQGSAPSVAAAVKTDWPSSVTYLQPLWLPNKKGPAWPLFEILGPYVGYRAVEPRLPPAEDTAAITKALWDECEKHSGYKFA